MRSDAAIPAIIPLILVAVMMGAALAILAYACIRYRPAAAPARRHWYKWAGLAASAFCTVLWLGSLIYVLRIPGCGWTARLCYGAFDFFTPATQPPAWSLNRFNAMPPRLLPSFGSLRGGWFAVVPLWIPQVVFAGLTAYLFWREWRTRPGRCPSCGYDLTGNVSGVCPECGHVASLPVR
jgi:hypothetical protein